MNSKILFSILSFFLISSISISIAFVQNENFGLYNAFASSSSLSSSSSAPSSSNATNIVDEGNSTYSNSTQGNDLGVSKVIVIPNPNPAASGSEYSPSDDDNNNTESEVLTSNTPSPQKNESSIQSQDALNTQQPSSNNSSMQRGEYKVDNNGIHYYNVNNCSLVKGSSGIGDLSECEDAEREIQEELTG